MSQSRDDLFLKLAQQNDLLDDEQIREIESQLAGGSAASAREAALSHRWMTEKKAASLDQALDRALADEEARQVYPVPRAC